MIHNYHIHQAANYTFKQTNKQIPWLLDHKQTILIELLPLVGKF
jgi:hypothetical protein